MTARTGSRGRIIGVLLLLLGLAGGYGTSFAYHPQVQQLLVRMNMLEGQVEYLREEVSAFNCERQILRREGSLGLSAFGSAFDILQTTGNQQGAQNLAAQAAITIESVRYTQVGETASITTVVRNVGAVPIRIRCVAVAGVSTNAGFTGFIVAFSMGSSFSPPRVSDEGVTWSIVSVPLSLDRGSSATIILSRATGVPKTTQLSPGDRINIRVATLEGGFALTSIKVS